LKVVPVTVNVTALCVNVSADDPVASKLRMEIALLIVLPFVPLLAVKNMSSPVEGVQVHDTPPSVSDQFVVALQFAAPAPGIQKQLLPPRPSPQTAAIAGAGNHAAIVNHKTRRLNRKRLMSLVSDVHAHGACGGVGRVVRSIA
jgi:hypothetical protein